MYGFILTTRTRSAAFTRTWSDGFWYFESLRLRKVNAIAAMIATSSSTAAICSG